MLRTIGKIADWAADKTGVLPGGRTKFVPENRDVQVKGRRGPVQMPTGAIR